MQRKKCLFFGNGFALSLYKNPLKWRELFSHGTDYIDIDHYTLLYEANLLDKQQSDNHFKRTIADKLRNTVCLKNLKKSSEKIVLFGNLLKNNDISDILTTNYDKGIETILSEINGYNEKWPNDITNDAGEKIYSLRRKSLMQKDDHEVRIWKIHGDIDNIASISLGFDQYCGSIAKIDSYIKGKYRSSSGIECQKSIVEKLKEWQNTARECKKEDMQFVSWVDFFFFSDVYIAGFGMDYAETDIWWLINKRYRLKQQGLPINNRIIYLYSAYNTGEMEADKISRKSKEKEWNYKLKLFQIFDVEPIRIEIGKNGIKLIPAVFNGINSGSI